MKTKTDKTKGRGKPELPDKMQQLDIKIALSDDGVCWITSKAMKHASCTDNATRAATILVAEWLEMIECEFSLHEVKAQSEETKIAFQYYQQPLEAWEANYPVN